jgi:hypothetical protein
VITDAEKSFNFNFMVSLWPRLLKAIKIKPKQRRKINCSL